LCGNSEMERQQRKEAATGKWSGNSEKKRQQRKEAATGNQDTTRILVVPSVSKRGKVWGSGISPNVVWYVVQGWYKRAGLDHIAPKTSAWSEEGMAWALTLGLSCWRIASLVFQFRNREANCHRFLGDLLLADCQRNGRQRGKLAVVISPYHKQSLASGADATEGRRLEFPRADNCSPGRNCLAMTGTR